MKLKIGRFEFEGTNEELTFLLDKLPNVLTQMRNAPKEKVKLDL